LNPGGASAISTKLPSWAPVWNWPETLPFASVRPQPSVGSVMVATPGSSNRKQICTPGIGAPLPETSAARNPAIVFPPSALTELGALKVKQFPPAWFGPAGEQLGFTAWAAACEAPVPPPVPPHEE
jgi:hypothetical protein